MTKQTKSRVRTKAVSPRAKSGTTRFKGKVTDKSSGEVRFGSVIVEAIAPSAKNAKRNIAEGRTALSRAKKVLLNPGVQVKVGANVPLYHADPAAPGQILQTLRGRTTRGRFVGGRFKPA